MADQGQVISGIDWRNTFSFTHIFRSFRIAIHLSKLALGLALLLTVYFGGRIMDAAWPARARAVPGEIDEYEQIATGKDQTNLAQWRQQVQSDIDESYAQRLMEYQIVTRFSNETDQTYHDRALDAARRGDYLKEVHQRIIDHRDNAVAAAKSQPEPARSETIVDAYSSAEIDWHDARLIEGIGLFGTFFQYEVFQITGVVKDGVLGNNWLDTGGVKDHVYNFFAIGPMWLIWNHTVFFIIFAMIFLLAWALFGGAICRIAAVHYARDEKISVRQAMNFAVGKLLSFASAPVIPLAIILVIGLIVSVAALIGNIPVLGPITMGALFVLPLLAGFVMTLVLLGTAGGFGLMYPTIAVEGSDSFDAISRSFSYVYARPWRMLFYSVVALAYGAATYIFVHMFIWLALVLTHKFVGLSIFTTAANSKNLLTAMWPNPLDTGRLSYSADYPALSPMQAVGAFFMNCWVMLMVSFLGAFAISLYFSTNTIIYYLMRSEVDSTELDDVYLEQSEEDMEPMLPGGAAVAVTTETTVIIEPTTGSAPTSPPA
jgi:hypothetical protein